MRRISNFAAWFACVLILGLTAMAAAGKDGVAKSEWRFYGGDQGSTKYSPLDQINRENVQKLKVAWSWDSPDLKILEQNSKLYTLGNEATPIMIGGVLYVSTSLSQVAAIDSASDSRPISAFCIAVLPTGPTAKSNESLSGQATPI
jgi:glucose dehydrogenase